jgi:hypothetical protein
MGSLSEHWEEAAKNKAGADKTAQILTAIQAVSGVAAEVAPEAKPL